MLDGQEYEFLKTKYDEYLPIHTDESTTYLQQAFNDLLESVGMVLKKYKDECKAMEKWYEEQKRKMVMERQRIAVEIDRKLP